MKSFFKIEKKSLYFIVFSIISFQLGCQSRPPSGYKKSFPPSSELGHYVINGQNYKINRVVMHTHSPFSYDACDKNPNTVAGFRNESCLASFKGAQCQIGADYVFVTDHPKNMEEFEFSELILNRGSDQALSIAGGNPYLNKMTCSNGQITYFSVGFESNLIGMGLKSHWGNDPATRSTNYMKEMVADPNSPNTFLLNDSRAFNSSDAHVVASEAILAIPHPEQAKWTIEAINAVHVNGFELVNPHTLLAPKIRLQDLKISPFLHVANILTYLIDPFSELIPDFAFINFVEIFPQHRNLWYSLLAQYLNDTASPPTNPKMFGYFATDSHENIFSPKNFPKASDNQRFDSHERIGRIGVNHVFSVSPTGDDLNDFDQLKTDIKKGQTSLVFEGFGSPVNMLFYGLQPDFSSNMFILGSELNLSSGDVELNVQLPTLHSMSPSTGRKKPEDPIIQIKLIRITGDGPAGSPPTNIQGKLVKTTVNTSLKYSVTSGDAGAYIAEVTIIPKHLRRYLSDFAFKADQEFTWIITNPIYIRP